MNTVIKHCPWNLDLLISLYSLPLYSLSFLYSPISIPTHPREQLYWILWHHLKPKGGSLACSHLFNCLGFIHPLQSLEPLPSSGPDFGALGEEAEFVEVEPEAKQEILENKDVSILWNILIWLFLECSLGKPLWRSKGALVSPICK